MSKLDKIVHKRPDNGEFRLWSSSYGAFSLRLMSDNAWFSLETIQWRADWRHYDNNENYSLEESYYQIWKILHNN